MVYDWLRILLTDETDYEHTYVQDGKIYYCKVISYWLYSFSFNGKKINSPRPYSTKEEAEEAERQKMQELINK